MYYFFYYVSFSYITLFLYNGYYNFFDFKKILFYKKEQKMPMKISLRAMCRRVHILIMVLWVYSKNY